MQKPVAFCLHRSFFQSGKSFLMHHSGSCFLFCRTPWKPKNGPHAINHHVWLVKNEVHHISTTLLTVCNSTFFSLFDEKHSATLRFSLPFRGKWRRRLEQEMRQKPGGNHFEECNLFPPFGNHPSKFWIGWCKAPQGFTIQHHFLWVKTTAFFVKFNK